MPMLVTVNGESIDTASALRLSLLHDNTFLKDTVRALVVRQYAEKQNIRNTEQELQLAADELRYARGLEAVDATHQWMRANHQSLLSIQESIDQMLLHNKVRSSIPDAQVEAYFAEHQLDFEEVELYSIRVDSEQKARELMTQVTDESANFHAVAMAHSQDDDSKHLGGYVGKLRRLQMTGAVEAAVFKAKPGSVTGPFKTDKGWNLFKVASIHKPTLGEAKSEIRVKLMEQLVDKLVAEASVTYPVFDAAV